MNPRTLSAAQLKKVWTVARELRWDSEYLHWWVETNFGEKSLRALSRDVARVMIDRMESLVGRVPSKGYRERGFGVRENGELQEYVTPAEIAKLRALRDRAGKTDAWVRGIAARACGRHISGLAEIHRGERLVVMNLVEAIVKEQEQRRRQKEIF